MLDAADKRCLQSKPKDMTALASLAGYQETLNTLTAPFIASSDTMFVSVLDVKKLTCLTQGAL